MAEPVWCRLNLLSPIWKSEIAALEALDAEAQEGSVAGGSLGFGDVHNGEIGNLTVNAVECLRKLHIRFSWSWCARDGVCDAGVTIYQPKGGTQTFVTDSSGRIVLTVAEAMQEEPLADAKAAQELLDAGEFRIFEDVTESPAAAAQEGEEEPQGDDKVLTIHIPAWAWDVLSGSLELDAISSAADPELRDRVRRALCAVEVADVDHEGALS